MSLVRMQADAVVAQLETFATIVDARSESEFALDHLPGAVNWPTLHDDERQAIGTMYVQVSAFEAKKRGAAIAARNISQHIEAHVLDQPKGWNPLVYCWRGGKRSGSLALVLDQIGFRVTLIDGGYKAFRAAMLRDLETCVARLQFQVVCGTTGSGKTRLLHALERVGAQVLDLEDLACHRSSVLGAIPGRAQPSQKHFDTLVWNALRRFDPQRPVYVESESKKVGNVSVADALVNRMRNSPCLELRLPMEERVALLMEDYDTFVQDQVHFCERLDALTQARGKATIQRWKDTVMAGDTPEVVRELLTLHYDPVYVQSMERNFVQYTQAQCVAPRDHTDAAMSDLAAQLLTAQTTIAAASSGH